MRTTSPGSKSRVLSLPQLLRVVRRLRRQGKRIALTNGCFDLLHVGHLSTLERIKSRADCLIVAINSDRSVRRLKGLGRPFVTARERARLLSALRPVDYVTIFSEPTPLRVIRAVSPHIVAKGGDWRRGTIVGEETVVSSGGQVLIIPYLAGHSTSCLVRRIRKGKGLLA